MSLNNGQANRVLNRIGFLVVVLTAFFEFILPPGVFIAWGYFLGVLLTIPHNRKRSTISASLLSGIIILLSMLYLKDEADPRILIQNRLYAFGGLLLVTLFAIRDIITDKTASNDKALMAGIFSHGTESIILIDSQNRIVLTNPFAKNLFGYPQTELEGHNIKKIIPGFLNYLPLPQQDSIRHFIPSEKIEGKKELFGMHQNGNLFPIEISFNNYKSGETVYTVIFATDITLRKQNEQKLKEKRRELEIANQELEAFTYSVSHDLRAPLRGVSGYAQMLQEDYQETIDSDGKRLLHNIQYHAEKMGQLIDDLLSFSRLGKKRINKAEIDLEAMTQQIVNELSEVNPHHADIHIHPLHHVYADRSLLNQVMINLISNALKYSSKKENPIIEIISELEEDQIIISIKDNGAGFDPKYAHKLFGVFQRLHTETEFTGTGVGLAIVQRIIHKHNGKVWAESIEGEGATFHFSLPNNNLELKELTSTHNIVLM